MKKIKNKKQLLNKLRDWLGYDGISFFVMCLDEYNDIAPVWDVKFEGYSGRITHIPHAVHWNEGMAVRNFLRTSRLCTGWNSHDYDNNWTTLVKEAITPCL